MELLPFLCVWFLLLFLFFPLFFLLFSVEAKTNLCFPFF